MDLESFIAQDEQRAGALNVAKAAIEAEHLTLVRRVFKSLPNPLPEAAVIRAAFKADPEFKTLTGRNAARVMRLIIDRCRANGWRIPDQLHLLEHWASLYVKWQWYCCDRLQLVGEKSLPRLWEGRAKADVEKTCPLLRPPKKRKASRNYWYTRAPFRMMFGNETCGMSWLREDFAAARTFLLLDGDRILVGVVPRTSRFCPHTLPDALSDEPAYRLYEETVGAPPRLRAVPKTRIDTPCARGLVMLFELDGRALRGKSNPNAAFLRAVFSPENLADPVLHLDRATEFHVRKGTDIPRDGKGEHFRQRFTEGRLFITFNLTINVQQVAAGKPPKPFGDLADYIAQNPSARLIHVSVSPTGGYLVTPQSNNQTIQQSNNQTILSPSLLVGTLARLTVMEDAAVLFSPRVPRAVRQAVADKFAYIVLKDRSLAEPGGVLRGYQLSDRLFVGARSAADEKLRQKRAEQQALERVRREKAARKAANIARAEEARRLAALRHSTAVPDFSGAPFQTGSSQFKVVFRTTDNQRHEATCRAETRDEMFTKMRSVGIRPSTVTLIPDEDATPSPPADALGERLKRLKALRDQDLVDEAEYVTQRERILSEL